jgi:hypothetical protein
MDADVGAASGVGTALGAGAGAASRRTSLPIKLRYLYRKSNYFLASRDGLGERKGDCLSYLNPM